ncbi:hypothetical protein LguiB_019810 [Lonicera macranthoides]
MSSNNANQGQGVSNCYVFKSLLQEYAQKAKLPTPVYSTTKEGPSHEPSFRSTVVLNGVRYDSLPGFFSRKAAEQSAAEVALMQLANSGAGNESCAQPVVITSMVYVCGGGIGTVTEPMASVLLPNRLGQFLKIGYRYWTDVYETGLCKNLLQEYAQKMNYAIPSYECRRNENAGREGHFSCSVEIGGIKYIGAAARTRKDAEIKVARTALLAIHSAGCGPIEKSGGNSIYTVMPCKKKAADSGINPQGAAPALKPKKKGTFKKKLPKKRHAFNGGHDVQNKENAANLGINNVDGQTGQELSRADALVDQDSGRLLLTDATVDFPEERSKLNNGYNVGELSAVNGALVPFTNGGLEAALDFQQQGNEVTSGGDGMNHQSE